MAKSKRKPGEAGAPAALAWNEPFTLWGRGNVLEARRLAKLLLGQGATPVPDAPAVPAPSLEPAHRVELERLLADTAPDPRAFQIGLFAVTVIVVVVILTRFLS